VDTLEGDSAAYAMALFRQGLGDSKGFYHGREIKQTLFVVVVATMGRMV